MLDKDSHELDVKTAACYHLLWDLTADIVIIDHLDYVISRHT